MNKYDLEHACTAHPRMSKEAWQQVYADAWKRYYTDEHVETIMRRAVTSGLNPSKILDAIMIFSGSSRIEGVHPLQFGIVRRKVRTQRRSGMPNRQSAGLLSVARVRFCSKWRRNGYGSCGAIAASWRASSRIPRAQSYIDEALRPVRRQKRARSPGRNFRRQDSENARRAGAHAAAQPGSPARPPTSGQFCSRVPASSRAILARCMIQSRALSSRNSAAVRGLFKAQSAAGVSALAVSAASEE